MGTKGTVMMAKKTDNLFGTSRFVLSEQRELYLQMKEDDKLVPMPIFEQDEMESFQYVLRDTDREDYPVTVSWWKPVKGELGTTCTMWGGVK
ncbi:YolD-like family protein [Brevibacillus brevis]|uniref:YolD-like family protein n=1 Tax=Brevibacillus brevis TaxID=1393 RepID=UPI00336A74AA